MELPQELVRETCKRTKKKLPDASAQKKKVTVGRCHGVSRSRCRTIYEDDIKPTNN